MPRFALAALAVLLALPASASATTTVSAKLDYFKKTQLTVKGDGAPSDLTVAVDATGSHDLTLTVTDAANPVAAGAGCTAATATSVTCHGNAAQIEAGLAGGADRLAFAASAAWERVVVTGGDGDDAADTSQLTKVPRLSDIEAGVTFGGGKGNDTFAGGSAGEDADGGPGDDVLHGGDGRDTVDGGAGADQLFGEGGNDNVWGDADDTAFDAGPGNDFVSGNGELEMNCGDGEDAVAIDFADDPPGPVVPDDCETIEITRASPRPLEVRRRTITFAASGSQDGYGRNTATMELTWKGKVVSTRRFRAGGRAVPVRLALPRALARAMKRAPQTVGVTVRQYLWDRDGVGEDYDPTSFTWRVRVSR